MKKRADPVSDDGRHTLAEYALLLAFIALACVIGLRRLL
jgi:Flp pilus assembly pilin Flp